MTREETARREVDPWRFTGKFLAGMLSGAIPAEPSHPPIPWSPVAKPVSQSKLALLTTAGVSMRDDEPFDMELERKRPTRGDASWRRLRADATSATIRADHLHIDTGYIERDLNGGAAGRSPARSWSAQGAVGAIADSHYSIMGFQGNDASAAREAERTRDRRGDEGTRSVDLALLAPV